MVCDIGDHHRLNFRFNVLPIFWRGPSWYGSWIYNYICNQSLPPLMLWVRISIRARCTTLCDKVCQWLATGQWFSPGSPVSLVLFKADLIIISLKIKLFSPRYSWKKLMSWSYTTITQSLTALPSGSCCSISDVCHINTPEVTSSLFSLRRYLYWCGEYIISLIW
jgi:hypothetical protein